MKDKDRLKAEIVADHIRREHNTELSEAEKFLLWFLDHEHDKE